MNTLTHLPHLLDEGYIKYQCHWQKSDALPINKLQSLNTWRNRLYQANLIGCYKDLGIGFGNISVRWQNTNQFIISGTQTGSLPQLQAQHYTKVTNFDLAQNRLTCQGPIKASSESLTHAAIYQLSSSYKAVIHVHHWAGWKQLMHQVPTTYSDIPYGTPDMAYEIQRLYKEMHVAEQKIIIMGGHEEGILTFGENLAEAGEVLVKYGLLKYFCYKKM